MGSQHEFILKKCEHVLDYYANVQPNAVFGLVERRNLVVLVHAVREIQETSHTLLNSLIKCP